MKSARTCATAMFLGAVGLLAPSALAQETLGDILARGFVANWLVCGPFPVDVPGGVVNAANNQQATLGTTDPMTPLGGIAQVRPRHLMSVPTAAGEAIWQQAGTDAPSLDLGPFFPDAREGMAYAAFYTIAEAGQQALIDLQTPFGARIWHNGQAIRQLSPGPLANIGVDRFVANFREGLNLIVIQMAGASFEALSEAYGLSPRAFQERHFAQRNLLEGKSGFEIALALHPVEQAGTVFVVPRLEDTGTFTGTDTDLRQLHRVKVFNASRAPSEPVGVVVQSGAAVDAAVLNHGALFPAALEDVDIPVPIGGAMPGDTIPVTVTVNAGEDSVSFTDTVTARHGAQPGTIHIIAGHEAATPENPSQAIETNRRILALADQLAAHAAAQSYGFELGPVSAWAPLRRARPELAAALRDGAGRGAVAGRPGYSAPDHRLVSGELLVRNLELGQQLNRRWLGVESGADLGLGRPALAPQWPQMLALAEVRGMVSGIPTPMTAALSQVLGPDGTTIALRRKAPSPAPGSREALRNSLLAQRAPLLETGVTDDVYLHRSGGRFPDPVLEQAVDLEGLTPRLPVQGSGAETFFRQLRQRPASLRETLPLSGLQMNREGIGAVVAHPNLKRAYALAEAAHLGAETLATLAALEGAAYPGDAMAYGWEQLLYWTTPERLGLPAATGQYTDALAAFRDVAARGEEISQKSAAYLAGRINTLAGGPPNVANGQAIVVFNPGPVPYDGPCALEITLPSTQGVALFDANGNETPVETAGMRRGGDQIDRITLRFVARNVPPMGYSTYYAVPGNTFPQARTFSDAQIDNDHLVVIADPVSGDIVRITDQRTGHDHAAGPLNRFIALGLDPDQGDNGRELWTTGTRRTPSRIGPSAMEQSPIRKTLRFTHDFLGGTLEREVTLYTGLNRIDFRTRLIGADLNDSLVTAVFPFPAAARAPIFGERFGAIQGGRGDTVLEYRTNRDDHPQAGLYPAWQWAAVSPADHLQIGLDQDIPLRPAYVIHGADPTLQAGAHRMVEALTQRGIPAVAAPASLAMPPGLWRDDTYPPGGWPALRSDPWMRVLIGSPEQNPLSAAALGRLPQDRLQEIAARGAEGAAVYFEDIPDSDRPAIPTLVLFALSPRQSADFAAAVAESIASRGVLAMPPAMDLSGTAAPAPDRGGALFFPGSQAVGADSDGAMTLLLASGVAIQGGHRAARNDQLVFDYAFSPAETDWRSGRIPHLARNYNTTPVPVAAPLQAGTLPPRHSFLTVEGNSPLVSSLRPAPADVGEALHPARDGVHLRLWEPYGEDKSGRVVTAFPIRRANTVNLAGRAGATVETGNNGMAYELSSFGIRTYHLLPNIRASVAGEDAIAPAGYGYSPASVAYWHHNTGAPPPGEPPVCLTLRGDLEATESTVLVSLGHLRRGEILQGIVQFQAPEGWIVRPERFEFALRPHDTQQEEVTVVRQPGAPTSGALVAMAHLGGDRVREVLQLGPPPLEAELTRTHAQLKVTLRNQSASPAEGFVELVVPPAYWGNHGRNAGPGIEPRRAAVAVAPHDIQTLLFRLTDPDAAIPATLKIAANNTVVYVDLPD